MQTIEYKVAYKRGVNELPETATFNGSHAAYAFALNIEVNGGVAIVAPIPKEQPLAPVSLFFPASDY